LHVITTISICVGSVASISYSFALIVITAIYAIIVDVIVIKVYSCGSAGGSRSAGVGVVIAIINSEAIVVAISIA
jgi:hypothetical protein